jgi:NADH-quinone oxidoreductase subunit N
VNQGSQCFELWAIVPELVLAGLVITLVPVAGWARGKCRQIPVWTAIAGVIAALGITIRMLPWPSTAVFCDTYAVDGFAAVFKLLILLGALITLILIIPYFSGYSQLAHAPIAVLFSALGGMGLASSLDLGLIVLFLQMLSLASYVLVGLVRSDRIANEAMIKYFIYAAVALAIMAYGLTFLYGLTGSLELRAIGQGLRGADHIWIAVGLGFILVGYAFEMAVAPFHFWAPDAYHGATAPIAGFLSVVPKIAGFAGFIRFVLIALPDNVVEWETWVALLAVATMLIGNLVALRQTRLKRLLAYSSIAQAGYVLIALAVIHRIDGALTATAYYLAAYLFMNLGAFAVVAQLERAFGSDSLAMVRGLGRRSPVPAIVLALSMLSLAGIPPVAGFAGKVLLLSTALEGGLAWLAMIAGANMVIGLYYYVAIIAEMYLKPSSTPFSPPLGIANSFAQLFLIGGTLLLGILPGAGLRLIDAVSNLIGS